MALTLPPARVGGWVSKDAVIRLKDTRPFTLPPFTVPVNSPPAYRVSPCRAKARMVESSESEGPTPVTVSEFDPLIKTRLLTFDPLVPVAVK